MDPERFHSRPKIEVRDQGIDKRQEGGYPTVATIQEKSARLEAARKKVEEFVAAGGDLKVKGSGAGRDGICKRIR